MSDNEDLLGDDLGDHSLADYNLGNDEEDQLLADDYEGGSQNVPSTAEVFRESSDRVPAEYPRHGIEYAPQPVLYQQAEAECVVPNIVVEVPNIPPAHSTYAPYEPRHYEPEHSVPAAMPAAPVESPQIVPSEIVGSIPNDMSRERFISERPVGAQRAPRVRDIPDSLDKVVISGGGPGRGRTTWRNPQYSARHQHPYRRHHVRGNFNHRQSFPRPLPPPPQPRIELQDRPMDMPRPPFVPDRLMDLPTLPMDLPRLPMDLPRLPMDLPRPLFQGRPMELPRPPMPPMELLRPSMDLPMQHMDLPRPQIDLPRPPMELPRPPMDLPRPLEMGRPHMELQRPHMELQRPRMDLPRPPMDLQRPQFQQFQRFPFREERPVFNPMRPQFERPTMFYPRQPFQRFGPPMPQVTIRQNVPDNKEPEIRMLPLPGNIPGGLAGKKVLINPHFKGNFQPPVEGPATDIDDAAERFIAEQRNALARAATRNVTRRSPQRYIENTTIEIENDLARPVRRRSDDDLLRRQEEFIHANRAGLRRRMRSPGPAPVRRSVSPRRSPERDRRHRPANEEESEYKRRVREQESMRERILRAKEVRRRKNAEAYNKQMLDREREEKEKEQTKPVESPVKVIEKPMKPAEKPTIKPADKPAVKLAEKPAIKPEKPAIKPVEVQKVAEEVIPDTTKKTPEREWTPELELRVKSPVKDDEVNSTCEGLTPPRAPAVCSDDELDLILGDIDGILSDDDDILNQPTEKPTHKAEPPQAKVSDLRSKLPPKGPKPPRQKIVFKEIILREDRKKGKSPPRRPLVSSTRADDSEPVDKKAKTKHKQESSSKSRQRIIFENKDLPKSEKEEKPEKTSFSNRRVILQRKPTKDTKSVFSRIEVSDPSKPNPGMFSRAVRTIERAENRAVETNRIVIKNEPEVEYDSSSDEERIEENTGLVALVQNLPHGMTDTRLTTLAGDVQSLIMDKEDRAAKITFKSPAAAETFKKKFNNKMVAASRLTVTLH